MKAWFPLWCGWRPRILALLAPALGIEITQRPCLLPPASCIILGLRMPNPFVSSPRLGHSTVHVSTAVALVNPLRQVCRRWKDPQRIPAEAIRNCSKAATQYRAKYPLRMRIQKGVAYNTQQCAIALSQSDCQCFQSWRKPFLLKVAPTHACHPCTPEMSSLLELPIWRWSAARMDTWLWGFGHLDRFKRSDVTGSHN